MTVRVVYHDNSLDMISAFILQLGIECEKIKMFYRESERKWITVGVDPVRKSPVESLYFGPERRLPAKQSESNLQHKHSHKKS
ncbi:MAG: GSU3473 family protein [Dissulfurispiraceae bacterium]|jgi:hypothetical protein